MRALDKIYDPTPDVRVEPYELRTLGDKAASSFLKGSGTLNTAVASVLKDQELNNHHIQRVVEYANLRAFREMRQAGGGNGTLVEFKGGPASAAEVIRQLRGNGSATKEAQMISPTEEHRKRSSDLLTQLDDMLGNRMTKEAAQAPLSEREEMDTVELYLKLGEAEAQCRNRVLVLAEKRASCLGEITRYAAAAIDKGASLGDLYKVLGEAAPDRPDLTKTAMDAIAFQVCPRFGLVGELADESMEKVSHAGRPSNPQHPLFMNMVEFTRATEAMETKQGAAEILSQNRSRLNHVLRSS